MTLPHRSTHSSSASASKAGRSPHLAILIAFLVCSLLLHLVVVAWMNDALPRIQVHDEDSLQTITAALIVPPPSASKPAPPKPKHKATSKPKPTPAPPVETPIPTAATPSLPEQDSSNNPSAIDGDNAASGVEEPVEPDYPVDLPPSVKLAYDVQKTPVEGQPTYGSGTITWRHDDRHYTVDGEFGVLFITALHFRSEGTVESSGIAPELYSEKRFRRAETNTHFHRERNTISFSASTKTYPRTGSEQDRASIIWQLAGIGRGDEARFMSGAVIEVIVAGTRDAEPWQIQVVDREDIVIDGQTISAWHVVRAPRARSYDQKLDIWLSPQLQWYPVRLRYTEPNGDVLDMTLNGLNVSAVP